MTSDAERARRAAFVGLGALGAFWVLVVVGGSLQPGYLVSRDFVSALASEGARFPLVGIVALLSFGVAYLAAAAVLDLWVGTRLGAALLVGAGLFTWVVAVARIHCPAGAAGCGHGGTAGAVGAVGAQSVSPLVRSYDSASTLGPHVHGWAVAASYALVAVTMLWLAILWRRRRHPLRAVASGAALVTSLATVPFWVGADSPGLAQRLWLGILSAWLVLVCVRPLVDVEEAQP